MLSSGSRSQIGSSRPATSQKRDSRCDGSAGDLRIPEGTPAVLVRIAAIAMRRAPHCAMVSRTAGRTRRTRSCTPPSSNMRDGAGMMSAARLGLRVDHEPGLAARNLGMKSESPVGGERLQPVLACDLDDLGLGAGVPMRVHRLAGGDG